MSVSYENFSDRSRKIMQMATEEAARFNRADVEPEHILLALVIKGDGVACCALQHLNCRLSTIRQEVEKLMQSGPAMVSMGTKPLSKSAERTLEYAEEERSYVNHEQVGDEHIILGLLSLQEGIPFDVLSKLGLILDDVRNEILTILGETDKDKPAATESDELPAAFRQIARQLRQVSQLANKVAASLSDIQTMIHELEAATKQPHNVGDKNP